MNIRILAVTVLLALLAPSVTHAIIKSWDTGSGTIYRLHVTQDVAIESPSGNHNNLPYLLVGKHPRYPNKRSLLQFESPPRSGCQIQWAKMYMYFVYAHKASWHSPHQAPYLNRDIMIHRVLKPWNEGQANTRYRMSNYPWSQLYLGLDGTDAENMPQSPSTTMFSYRPSGFVEFDVTRAVKDWAGGSPNYGLVVRVKDESVDGRGLRFASNADPDSQHHAFIHVKCA
ncbi:uncharacterized protein LOC116617085 [Nematostella vectensis]|uniref:uncharacterized protein LOC116617085 n=1 Tax=Nematostella vectensis TaxID=45351 RepID=UPI00138FC94C|nr:uncharacterized protein LOC116617085 [Nematostella vectensis]